MSGLQLRHKAASEDGMNKATYMQLSGTWHLHDNTYKGMGFLLSQNSGVQKYNASEVFNGNVPRNQDQAGCSHPS